jgi:hypothetical protein
LIGGSRFSMPRILFLGLEMCLEALQDQYSRFGYKPYEREERKCVKREEKSKKWAEKCVSAYL